MTNVNPKSLIKSFLLVTVLNVTGQFLFFIGMIHMARLLEPAGFGLWGFAQAWFLYLLRGQEMGFEIVAVREVSQNPSQANHWLWKVPIIRLLLTFILISTSISAVMMGFVPQGSGNLIIILSFTLIPMAFTAEWMFEANQRFGTVGIARFLKGASFLLFSLLFVSTAGNLSGATYAYAASFLIPALGTYIYASYRYGITTQGTPFRTLWSFFLESIPIGIAILLSQYALFFGTTLAGYVVDTYQLGIFTAAHRIVAFLWVNVVSGLLRILLPHFSRLVQNDDHALSTFIIKFEHLSAILIAPLALIACVLSPVVIPLIFGNLYLDSVLIFSILIWTILIGVMRAVFDIGLFALKKQGRYLVEMSILALAYTILTPLSVWLWGIKGIAIASILAEIICLVYVLSIFPNFKTKNLIHVIWKPLIVTVIAIIPFPLLQQFDLWLRIGISLTLLVIGFIATHSVTSDDIQLFRVILKRSPVVQPQSPESLID